MSSEDFEIFHAHLLKKMGRSGNLPRCPMCGTEKWSADGPVIALSFDDKKNAISASSGVPIALLVCANCSYMQSYAWMPIKAGPRG